MPIYEYRCTKCGAAFEMLRRFTQTDEDVICPECESEEVERVMSGFATGGSGSPGGCGGGRGRFT